MFRPVGLATLKKCLGALSPRQTTSADDSSSTAKGPQVEQFDLELIHSLTGGDQQLVRLLFNELHRSNSLDLSQLDEGLNTGRWRDQGQLVHRLKGAARMVGAQPVVQAALAYEDGVAESVDDVEMQRLAKGVHQSLVELKLALESWLAAQE